MTRYLTFDKQVDGHLTEIMNRLKKMGIKNVSKPMALRVIIEMNKEAQLKLKRKKRSKFGLMFND